MNEIAELDQQIEQALSVLNLRQRKFALLVSEGESGTQAAIKANYAKPQAASTASRMLSRNAKVKTAVSLLSRKHQLEHGIAAGEKRKRLLYIADQHRDANPAAAVRALHELNLMDGHHAAIQVKHNHLSVNVNLDYQVDLPERVIDVTPTLKGKGSDGGEHQ
jgi:phage terminase small subunit